MDIERLIQAAEAHGQQSESDHEVGDLQDVLRSCWATMTPTARRAVFAEHGDLLEWIDGDATCDASTAVHALSR